MYIVIGARLVQYGIADPVVTGSIDFNANAVATRPDILDRNGELLATDINTVSLYAEPRRIVDADEVVEKLATVLPNLDWGDTHRESYARIPASNGCDANSHPGNSLISFHSEFLG